MKNITFSANENLIERARFVARSENTTLNAAFREWLREYARQAGDVREFDALMERLRSHVKAGRRFTREEMNRA